MSAIIKVCFNTISETRTTPKDEGVPGPFLYYHFNDSSESQHEENPVMPFPAMIAGDFDEYETIAAVDVEDAIAKVREKVLAKDGFYWEVTEDENGKDLKKSQWRYTKVVAIQIVRAEPVAFTTL